jgi:hypothetical protein
MPALSTVKSRLAIAEACNSPAAVNPSTSAQCLFLARRLFDVSVMVE